MEALGIQPRLLAFDFDWSLLGRDTDDLVIEGLQATEVFEPIYEKENSKGWPHVVNTMLRVMQLDKGATIAQIETICRSAAVDEGLARFLRLLRSSKSPHPVTLAIVSDSNQYYIG